MYGGELSWWGVVRIRACMYHGANQHPQLHPNPSYAPPLQVTKSSVHLPLVIPVNISRHMDVLDGAVLPVEVTELVTVFGIH